MKILLIDVNCKFSSTGKIVYDLYTKINQSGNIAAIAYGRGNVIEEKNIYKFGIDSETKIHALLTRITGLMGYYSYFSTKRLKRFINDFNPDVIHIHELHSYFVNVYEIINFIKKKKIPVIWTHHCEWLYTGKCGYAYTCEKWLNGCGHCPEKKSYPTSLFFDFTRKMISEKKEAISDFKQFVNVFPSEWLANRARKSFINEYPIEVINNGIDTDIFHKSNSMQLVKKLDILEKKRIILSVAPDIMSERKGGRYVVELANRFKQDKQTVFIIVGIDGNDIIKEDNIIYIPKLESQKDLAEYYSIANIFLICSKCENFPTTCVEALCCGCIVIGFETGGTSETVKFGRKLFTKYGDVRGLELIIDNIEYDDYHYEKEYQEYYSKQRMFDDYKVLYNEIYENSINMEE